MPNIYRANIKIVWVKEMDMNPEDISKLITEDICTNNGIECYEKIEEAEMFRVSSWDKLVNRTVRMLSRISNENPEMKPLIDNVVSELSEGANRIRTRGYSGSPGAGG